MRHSKKTPEPPLTERERAYFGPRTQKAPGSVPWCWQTILLMKRRWEQKCLDEAGFQAIVDELKTQEAWNVVPPEQPYGSLEALLQAEIGYTEAEAKKQLIAQATGSSEKGGRPKTCDSHVLTQEERAQHNGVSRWTQSRLDYLAGHAQTLLMQVQEGTLSVHKAYQQAKGYEAETPLTTLHRVWRKVAPEDRLRFLIEMLTPNERRALFLGFEEEE